MLFFSSKKPLLKELIPYGYVDIHSHLLPGIDDGATSPKEGVQLMNALQAIGFEQFITTPHIMETVWNNNTESIEASFQALNKYWKNSTHPIPIRTAAEYLMDAHFADLIKQQALHCLKDNYVLVEMSYINPPLQLMELIFDCQVAGYQPILAHPERYLFYHSSFDAYHTLKKAGCLFQLNLLSVTGYYGKTVAAIAEQLLSKGLIDFVGSDVHHQNHVKSFENKVLMKDTKPLQEAFANNQLFRY